MAWEADILKVKGESESESDVTQFFLTLWDPTDCSLPGSSVHGIFQARVLEWGGTFFMERHREHLGLSRCLI